MAAEDLVEAVLSLVERVPAGRATTFGTIAAAVGTGPRQVGRIMSLHGAAVTWWRVVRADGTLPAYLRDRAVAAYAAEGTPLRPGTARPAVDLRAAGWEP